jgi:hypothetical protein
VKKLLFCVSTGFFIALYFILTLFVLPEQFLLTEQLVPQPYLKVDLSDSVVSLGDSFRLDIVSENRGDYGDIHIVSVAFPDLVEIDQVVKIATYDFTQSSHYVSIGDKIGAKYSGGLESTFSKYPSIEAMTRPAYPEIKNHLGLIITPEKLGIFTIYVKSVDIPHTSNLSHYPGSGFLDHQDEYVLVYLVNVNP